MLNEYMDLMQPENQKVTTLSVSMVNWVSSFMVLNTAPSISLTSFIPLASAQVVHIFTFPFLLITDRIIRSIL